MPHDYQFWQTQRRTSSAQYRFFSTRFTTESIAALRGYVTVTARGPQRTANDAYWLQRTTDATTVIVSDPLPEELLNSIIPKRAPGAQRTANDQYWHNNQPQIADEIIGMRISELPTRAPGPQRATTDQYWHSNQPQIGDEVAGMPVWSIPDTARGARYVAPWRFFAIKSGGLDLPASYGSITEFARVAGRATADSYAINAKVHPPDLEPEELKKTAITDFARGAARAANTEYLIRLSPQINDEVVGMPVWSIPDRALGAARAADYLINLKPAINDEVVGMRVREITDFARGLQRTANTAYWYNNTQAAVIETAQAYFSEVRQAITERADGFSRAANPHYWIATWPVPTDVIVMGGRGHVSTFAKGAQRADRTAYDQPKRSVIITDVITPDFEEIRRRLLPDRAPGKQRAAAAAYWHDIATQVPDGTLFVCLDSLNFPQRAAPTAYWRNGQFVNPDVIIGEEVIKRVSLPSRADAKARAANTTYWRDNQPQINDEVAGMPVWNIPDRALGARRAQDYLINLSPQIGDEVIGMLVRSITEQAKGAARTATTAYLIKASFVIDDAVVELEEFRKLGITEHARGPIRPANSVYWRNNQLQIPDEIEGMLIRAITDHARGPSRAPNGVYVINNKFADTIIDFPIEVQQAITQVARGPQRAANTVYWAWVGQGTVIIDDVLGSTLRPMKTKNWHRNR